MAKLWTISPGDYHGLKMRCAPGVHEAAADLLVRHAAPRSGVLDLASGSGAFLARLRDLGFTDLAAVELDVPKFQVPGVTPLPLDLNADFAAQLPRTFNLISAIEIVEHLDSPRHFLSSIHRALAENGHLLISTPNISAWQGRLKFLLTGTLRHFDENQYAYNHHVSPVPHVQMLQMFREIGFALVAHATAGSFSGPLKRAATAPVDLAFRLASGPACVGDVNIYLARKVPAPPRTLPTDWTPSNNDAR